MVQSQIPGDPGAIDNQRHRHLVELFQASGALKCFPLMGQHGGIRVEGSGGKAMRDPRIHRIARRGGPQVERVVAWFVAAAPDYFTPSESCSHAMRSSSACSPESGVKDFIRSWNFNITRLKPSSSGTGLLIVPLMPWIFEVSNKLV